MVQIMTLNFHLGISSTASVHSHKVRNAQHGIMQYYSSIIASITSSCMLSIVIIESGSLFLHLLAPAWLSSGKCTTQHFSATVDANADMLVSHMCRARRHTHTMGLSTALRTMWATTMSTMTFPRFLRPVCMR